MPLVQFGEWLPDREKIDAPGVRIAQNLVPTANGWRWMNATRNLGRGSLGSPCIGADRGVTSSGRSWAVAGTKNDLFLDTSTGYSEVTNGGPGSYGLSGNQNWGFHQYGENIFAINGGVPQYFQFAPVLSSEFDDIDNQPDAIPNASAAKVGMVFNEFLVLGNIVGRNANALAIGTQEGGLHWCSIGAPFEWPVVGSDEATSTQSDFQVFEGDGGEIKAMVPMGEFALIFRERQTWRMDYVGPPLIFAFRKLDDHRGCIAQNGAIAVGNLCYYPTEDGFKVCNGAEVHSIGHEKIDRTWRNTLDYDRTARISVAHDGRTPAIYWTVPGATPVSPAAVLGYQYEIGQWFVINLVVEWLQTVVPSDNSLDELVNDPTYGSLRLDYDPATQNPGDADWPAGLSDVDLDTLGPGNIETLAAWLDDHELHAFDNTSALSGVIESGQFDLESRALLRWVRPVLTGQDGPNGVEISASFTAKNNPLDTGVTKSGGALNSVGTLPIRLSGRYISGRFSTSGKVAQLQGFDPQFQSRGQR